MAGSSTTLLNLTEQRFSPRKGRSKISKAYKQASELFLTRRLPEALSTIEPFIKVPQDQANSSDDDEMSLKAPIAGASRKTKIKVWVLYLTLLNAIAEMGYEDGSRAFGKKDWKSLTEKVKDGTIWDEVVEIGYEGIEVNVDAEVVASLATLLLAQSASQKSNQHHLESYLSASDNRALNFGDRLETSDIAHTHGGSKGHYGNETDNPRDLSARVHIIELYALHVLPKNGEWEYARDFLSRSEVLDEETREELLHGVQCLEEDLKADESCEDERPQQELSEQEPYPVETSERGSIDTVKQGPTPHRHRSNSQTDYGIDDVDSPSHTTKSSVPPPRPQNKPSKAAQIKSSRPQPSKDTRQVSHSNALQRSAAAISTLKTTILRIMEQLSQNRMGLLRFVLFLMGLIMAFSGRDVKDKLGRLAGVGWDKVKRTVGMGVKVSYI